MSKTKTLRITVEELVKYMKDNDFAIPDGFREAVKHIYDSDEYISSVVIE